MKRNFNLAIFFLLCLITNLLQAQDQSDPVSPVAVKHIKKFLQTDELLIQKLPLDAKNSTRFYGYYYQLMPLHNYSYCFIGRIKSCRANGCDLQVNVINNDEFEFFDYYILFDSTGSVIKTHVYNYEASHGHEIMIKKWLAQFSGYNGDKELELGKNIDAISGATISASNITKDIQCRTKELKEYLQAKILSQYK